MGLIFIQPIIVIIDNSSRLRFLQKRLLGINTCLAKTVEYFEKVKAQNNGEIPNDWGHSLMFESINCLQREKAEIMREILSYPIDIG